MPCWVSGHKRRHVASIRRWWLGWSRAKRGSHRLAVHANSPAIHNNVSYAKPIAISNKSVSPPDAVIVDLEAAPRSCPTARPALRHRFSRRRWASLMWELHWRIVECGLPSSWHVRLLLGLKPYHDISGSKEARVPLLHDSFDFCTLAT